MFGKSKQISKEKLKEVTLSFIKTLSENALSVKEDALQTHDIEFVTDLYNACIDLDRSVCNIIFGLRDAVLTGHFPDSFSEVSDESEQC